MRGTSDLVVLVLCTANQCRSPAAEAVLAERLAGTAVGVVSAGFAVRPGAAVDDRTRRALPDLAVEAVPRQLTPDLAVGADLVLTMTLAQRSAVVGLAPSCVRRAFTLTEFADLAELVEQAGHLPTAPAERLAALVQAAPRLRAARVADGPRRADDVEDPYLLDEAGYAGVMAQIVEAAAAVSGCVLGASASTTSSRSPSGVGRAAG